MDTFDLILTAAALIIGVMLLTGHGSIFMKGGNAEIRKKLYDEKKMEKGCGVALISKVAYIVILLIIIIGLMYYLRKKCRK